MTTKELLTIGQLAKRIGVRPSTLRFYEAEGLLSPAVRSEAGYRLYDAEAEQALLLIQRTHRPTIVHEWVAPRPTNPVSNLFALA